MTQVMPARATGIRMTHINRDVPWLRSRLGDEEYAGTREMLGAYSPFGEIRTVMTSLRAGIGTDGYQGSATPMSLDHVFRRIIGLPALATGLDRDIYGGGKGLSLHDSAMSSLGEGIERMLGSFSAIRRRPPGEEWFGSAADMATTGREHVGPDVLQIFHPDQLGAPGFLYDEWVPDSPLHWTRGTNILTGTDTWVPSQLVHLFYLRRAGEAKIGSSSSGGLAAHVTTQRALRHAVLELIERDAANLSWYSRIPLTRLEIDTEPATPAIRRWLDSAARAGVDVSFYLHRTDIPDVHVVTAIAVEDGLDEYSYLAGGGVGLDIESAMRSAIAELIQSERMIRTPDLAPNWRLVQGFQRMFGIHRDATGDDFQNFIQVVPYYGYAENQARLDWYLRPDDQPTVRLSELGPGPGGDVAAQVDALRDICRQAGLTPVVFDVTPPNFDHVKLLKVFIAELVPAFPPNVPMLGHRRYVELPVRLGLRQDPLAWGELTSDPLPYP